MEIDDEVESADEMNDENLCYEQLDFKDLKLLKPVVGTRDKAPESDGVRPTTWYHYPPKPLAINTFQLRSLGGGGCLLVKQRKLLHMQKQLRADATFTTKVGIPPKLTFGRVASKVCNGAPNISDDLQHVNHDVHGNE